MFETLPGGGGGNGPGSLRPGGAGESGAVAGVQRLEAAGDRFVAPLAWEDGADKSAGGGKGLVTPPPEPTAFPRLTLLAPPVAVRREGAVVAAAGWSPDTPEVLLRD